MIGYAFCGSYCTWSASLLSLRRLIELGVDCIMTDNPELLAEIIEEYRQKARDAEKDTNTDTDKDRTSENEVEKGI